MKVIGPDTARASMPSSSEVAAVTKHRQYFNSSAGFTLVELILVSAIIGVLAGLAIPAYNQFIQKVKVTRVISEIRGIEKDLLASIAGGNAYPNSLNDIGLGNLKDPWGNPYQYLNFANPGTPRNDVFTDMNTDFDLYSLGFDGLTDSNIKAANSLDDIIRTRDGGWVGIAENF